MKVSTFFKILNKKIDKYDKITKNPFTIPQSIIIVWFDKDDSKSSQDLNKNFQ